MTNNNNELEALVNKFSYPLKQKQQQLDLINSTTNGNQILINNYNNNNNSNNNRRIIKDDLDQQAKHKKFNLLNNNNNNNINTTTTTNTNANNDCGCSTTTVSTNPINNSCYFFNYNNTSKNLNTTTTTCKNQSTTSNNNNNNGNSAMINSIISQSTSTSCNTNVNLYNSSTNNNNNYINNNNNNNTSNEIIECEKANFFNILKSLFAVFDSECKGFIDVNELDNLGANNNEILNDVLNYIRTVHVNANALKSLNTTNFERANRTSSNSLVSFDEFVTAAEVVLNRRKQGRLQLQQHPQPTRFVTKNRDTDRCSVELTLKKDKKPRTLLTNATSDLKKTYNYSTLPMSSSLSSSSSCSSSSSSTPTSSSISPSSSSNTNKTLPLPASTTTLSQAFENASSSQTGLLSSHSSRIDEDEQSLSLTNANCLDVNNLIDNENHLLKQGLGLIDLVKQWYVNQLIQNKLKLSNVNKLKHQNLFSIDKMLLDLKQTNDLNAILNEFLVQHKIQPSSLYNGNKETSSVNQPDEFVPYESCGETSTNGTELELDNYLKEKQERIDNLQKEKSMLIKKLLEVKSKSDSINNNIQKLKREQKHVNETPAGNIFVINEQTEPDKGNDDSTRVNLPSFIEFNKAIDFSSASSSVSSSSASSSNESVKSNDYAFKFNKSINVPKIKKLY